MSRYRKLAPDASPGVCSVVWSASELMDLIAQTVAEREQALRDEQAVYGLDALSEAQWQPLIARALGAEDRTVLREVVYPAHVIKSHRRHQILPESNEPPDAPLEVDEPRLDRERERCDVAVLPAGCRSLLDPIGRQRSGRAMRQKAQGSLFEAFGERDAVDVESETPEGCCPPGDAFWLEVKLVGQYEHKHGVPGPNRTYASQLVRGVLGDLTKLSGDKHIVHAGALLVLFSEDTATAEHDTGVLVHRCLDRGLPIWSPERRSIPILDRIGNRLCTLMLIPVRPGIGAN